MPPVLTAKTAGLPRYVWIIIFGVALSGAAVLRSKSKKTSPTTNPTTSAGIPAVDSADPCDPTSTAYNPSGCMGGTAIPSNEGIAATDSGDVCDPSSVSYDSGLCNQEMTGASSSAAAGGVQTFPSINVNYGAQITQGKAACKGARPKAKKGYQYDCKNGKWKLTKLTPAKKKVKKK